MNLPDVILVKKTFPKLRKRQKRRFWKLKHFEDEGPNTMDGGLEGGPEDVYEQPMENPDEDEKVKKPKMMSKKQIKKKLKETDKGDVKKG